MDGISQGVIEGLRRSYVVDQSSYWYDLSLVACFLPASKNGGNEVASEVAVKHLGEEVDV